MTIVEELELLTGKLIRGDITPIVYDLIHSSGITYTNNDIDLMRKEMLRNDSEADNNTTTAGSLSRNPCVSVDTLLKRSKRVHVASGAGADE